MVWAGIQRTSTIDFPKTLACVLFTGGCDFDCFYCHNRSYIRALTEPVPEDEILAFLEKRKGLLSGVVVSGGEPTLQPGLRDFIKKIKGMGYKVKLDSNGQRPEIIEKLLAENLLDYVAIDVKALPDEYVSVCGVSGFDKLSQTISLLFRTKANFEVRTTLYPTLTMKELEKLLSLFPNMPLWRLNLYNMPEIYDEKDVFRLKSKAITKEEILNNFDLISSIQPNISI